MRSALGAATAGIAYYILTALSLHFRVGPNHISFIWPPTALVLALLARAGWKSWGWMLSALFIASVIANAEVGRKLDLVLLLTLVDLGAPAAGALVLRRFLDPEEPLSFRGELVALTGVCSGVAVVSAFLGIAVLAYSGLAPSLLVEWRLWATSSFMGMLILAPVLLAATTRRIKVFGLRRSLETACILSLLAFFSWLLFQHEYMTGVAARIAVYASLPILLLSGFRTGVFGSAVSIAIVGTIGAWQLASGGLLPGSDESTILDQVEWAEAYFATVAISTLVLSVLFEEFQATLRDRNIQNRVLERLASGETAAMALTELVESIEARSPGMTGSVLILDGDGKSLRVAVAPGLPPEYNRLVDGIQIGPVAGSCGTAAYRRERVIVRDVLDDPLWAPLIDKLGRFGFRACWSQPITGTAGQVLGTFAMYYDQPRSPTRSDIRLIESAAHLAGVALERYRMQSALRERERAYSSLVSNLSGMVYRCRVDNGWNVELISDFARTLTGYAPEDFRSDAGITFDSLIHPDDLKANRALIREALVRRSPIRLEYRIRTRDGTEKWVWDQAQGVYDDAGNAVAIEGIVSDITARKLAEQEAVSARRVAEQANRAKDQFLAMLSHELRTPLTPVLLYACSLEADTNLTPEQRQEVRVIRQQVELESRLIDDLLDVTRIQRGKFLVTRRRLDLAEVVAKVVEAQRPVAEEKNIVLSATLRATSHQMDGDPSRLQQMVSNLIGNAIKFTPSGGSVMIRTHDVPDSDRKVLLEVTDTGIGIAHDVLPKLFVAFEQGHRGNSAKFGGLGLGLAIVKAIAEIHGGSVKAASPGIDRGATLTVELPTLPTQTPHTPGPTPPVNVQRPLRILLVEDDKPTSTAIRTVLEQAGHTTITADSLASALSHLQSDTPELLISDIQLPDGDGLTLMRRLREMKPVVAGIALSGYGTDEDVVQSRAAGFTEHLVKPVDSHSLVEAIHRTTQDV